MKYPYLDKYRKEDCRLASFGKALGHPVRLAILRYLYQNGESPCGELVGLFPFTFATISRHLKILREMGIIKGVPHGPFIRYSLDPSLDALIKKHLKIPRGGRRHGKRAKEVAANFGMDLLEALFSMPIKITDIEG